MAAKTTGNQVMRAAYRALSSQEVADMTYIKERGADLYDKIVLLGESRELSIAKTKLEEAVMWAVKHITG